MTKVTMLFFVPQTVVECEVLSLLFMCLIQKLALKAFSTNNCQDILNKVLALLEYVFDLPT